MGLFSSGIKIPGVKQKLGAKEIMLGLSTGGASLAIAEARKRKKLAKRVMLGSMTMGASEVIDKAKKKNPKMAKRVAMGVVSGGVSEMIAHAKKNPELAKKIALALVSGGTSELIGAAKKEFQKGGGRGSRNNANESDIAREEAFGDETDEGADLSDWPDDDEDEDEDEEEEDDDLDDPETGDPTDSRLSAASSGISDMGLKQGFAKGGDDFLRSLPPVDIIRANGLGLISDSFAKAMFKWKTNPGTQLDAGG